MCAWAMIARLDAQSLLPDGAVLSQGEQRRGSPGMAAKVPVPAGEFYRAPACSARSLFVPAAWLAGTMLALVGRFAGALSWRYALADGVPVARFGRRLGIMAALVPVLVVFTCLWVVMLKAMILRRAKPGIYPSIFLLLPPALARLRAHACEPALLCCRSSRRSICRPGCAYSGAKIGKHAEMSTCGASCPNCSMPATSAFFADGCMLGGTTCVRRPVSDRASTMSEIAAFIGNGAILPTGASLGERCFWACFSAPPYSAQTTPGRHRLARLAGVPTAQPAESRRFRRRGDLPSHTKALCPTRSRRCAAHPDPGLTGFVLGVGLLAAVSIGYEVSGMCGHFRRFCRLGLLAAAAARWRSWSGLKWVVMGRFKPVIVAAVVALCMVQ